MNKENHCKWEDGSFKCERSLHDDNYCVFHSKDKKMEKKDFEKEVFKELGRQENEEEEYNFRGFMFPLDIDFSNRQFEKNVYFTGAQFSRKADFREAQFSGKADFQKVQFSGKVEFSSTKFSKEAYFRDAQFSGSTFFWSAYFSKEADFQSVKFSEEFEFPCAKFFGKADFTGIKLINPNDQNKLNKFNMKDTYMDDVVGLFEYIEWNKKNFEYPDKTEFLPEKISPILGDKAKDKYPIISRKIQDDKFIIAFKKNHPRLHFFWWLFADCGRTFLRWALWSLMLALLFAFIYHNGYYLGDRTTFNQFNIHNTWPGFSFIYYSVVTFTTLGFGDIVPKPGWLQFWVMLEVIIGYIMLGGLISILSNKLARRS